MGFSLSTSWNAFRHTKGKELIFEIKELGFQEAELSFNLTASMVNDIELLVEAKEIRVTSIHNFCPIPEGYSRANALPDCFSMASCDEEERIMAVRQACITIDTASRLKGKAVVLHCGRVEVADKTRHLIELYRSGMADSAAYSETKNRMIEERGRLVAPFFENACRSLEEINSYAQRKQILLGIENRFYYREIPSQEEIGIILKKFAGSNIRYWHDVGHGYIMHSLGLAQQNDYLGLYGGALAGMHLHDVKQLHDHLPPGEGEFQFSCLKPHLKEGTLLVIEAHHPATGKAIRDCLRLLKKTL